jgi:hypothetical protein
MTIARRIYRSIELVALIVNAWVTLAIVDVARLRGFARVRRLVERTPTIARMRPASTIADIVWAVDEACVWYVKRAACLQRSVAAARMLRRRGHRATLVIGCRPIPFESHAWVEVDGAVVNDRPQYQKAFAVLDRV